MTWSYLCEQSRVPNHVAVKLQKLEQIKVFMVLSDATRKSLLQSIEQQYRKPLLKEAKILEGVSECPMSYILARDKEMKLIGFRMSVLFKVNFVKCLPEATRSFHETES